MTKDKIVWEDPPPNLRPGPGVWQKRLEPLRQHPGKWAKMYEYSAAPSACRKATELRLRFPDFEIVSRGKVIYARYVGDSTKRAGMESG